MQLNGYIPSDVIEKKSLQKGQEESLNGDLHKHITYRDLRWEEAFMFSGDVKTFFADKAFDES